jgi:hypothetical protein
MAPEIALAAFGQLGPSRPVRARALATILTNGAASATFAWAQVVSLLVGNQSNFAGLDRYTTPNGVYAGTFGVGSPNAGQFNYFVYGPAGDLFIEQGTNVLKYNGHTGAFISTFTTVLGGQFAFGADGNMYRVEPFSSSQSFPRQIGKYDGTTGVRLGTFVSSSVSGVNQGDGNIKFGPDGNLYVDNGSNIVRFNGTTGAPMGNFTQPGSGGLGGINDFLFASNGKLLVSGVNSGTPDTIYQFDGTTGAYTGNFAMGNGLNFPFRLAEGADGNLYVASEFTRNIKRFNLTTGAFVDDWVPSTAGNRFPSYIGFTPFPVPEPSSAILALAGIAVLVRSMRRRTDRTRFDSKFVRGPNA